MPAPNLQIIAAMEPRDVRALSEDDFSLAVREYAGARDWKIHFNHKTGGFGRDGVTWRGNAPPGYPDLTMVRGPQIIWLELKAMDGVPTPDQRAWINALKQVPGGVAMFAKPDMARELQELLK